MDCLTARRIIDGLHPVADDARGFNCTPTVQANAEDASALECAQAAEHVHGCPQCQEIIAFRQQFDQRAGLLCRDVPVPVDLKARLLQRLAGAQAEETVSSRLPVSQLPHEAVPQVAVTGRSEHQPGKHVAGRQPGRRRFLIWSLSLAASLLISGLAGLWYWQHATAPMLAMDRIEKHSVEFQPDENLSQFTAFHSGLAAPLPRTMRITDRLRSVRPKSFEIDGEIAAVYFFSIGTKRGNLAARLIVLPKSAVKSPPPEGFLRGGEKYVGTFSTTAWTEGEFVYLCCIQGGQNELERLLLRQNAS